MMLYFGIDNILACFKGTERVLIQFLNYIRSFHSKIKCTLETETDKKHIQVQKSPLTIFIHTHIY